MTESMSMQMSDEAKVYFHGVSGRTTLRPNEVKSFENECVILGHPKLFNQWVQWSDSVDGPCDSHDVDIDYIV